MVKNLPAKQEMQVWAWSGGSLEEELALLSNILAREIPWTEGFSGGLVHGIVEIKYD